MNLYKKDRIRNVSISIAVFVNLLVDDGGTDLVRFLENMV